MKHTKGPWKQSNLLEERGLYRISIGSANSETKLRAVCSITKDSLPTMQDYSNAALIAAAPEMLEVLEEIVLQYETGILNKTTIDVLAKFVIKKAKGGDS